MRKLKLLIADDHKLVREGIKTTLKLKNNLFHFELLEEAENGKEAIEKASINNYDLIFMDVNMPVIDGITATKKIVKINSDIKIIALSMHNEEYQIKSMLNAGVSGYIFKNTGLEELYQAIEVVLNGKKFYNNEVAKILLRNSDPNINNSKIKEAKKHALKKLSKRELQVLTYIANEYSNAQIATKLKLSIRTIENHKYNILHKLEIKNTAGLMKFALKNNIT